MIDNMVGRKKREDDEARKVSRRKGRGAAPTRVNDSELFKMADIGVKKDGN